MARPELERGRRRVQTSVSLTRQMQIQFRRLGGSKWLRNQITEAMKHEITDRAGLAGVANDAVGKA